MRGNGDHSVERSLLCRRLRWQLQLSCYEFVALLLKMLVKYNLVHSLSEFEIHLAQERCSIRGALTSKSLGILSHAEHSVNLVIVNFRNLMSRHVFNIVVVLNQRIGKDSESEGLLESFGKLSRVFFVEEQENSVKSAFLLSVFPVAFESI